MNPDVSVVIVNLNTAVLLRQCLESLYGNADQLSVEVFVVDNGSADSSVAMVREAFPQAITIANETNVGFAAANNQALTRCRGRYVLLLNSDTVVLEGALTSMVSFMDLSPTVSAAGCKLLNSDGSLQRSARCFPTLFSDVAEHFYLDRLFPRSKVFGKHNLGWWDYDGNRAVDWVSGACLILRRETVRDVGLLDERFFMYSEEMDWCYRLRQQGKSIYYIPEPQIIHFGGLSQKHRQEKMVVMLHKSEHLFRAKHGGRVAAACQLFVAFAGTIFKLNVLVLAFLVLWHRQERIRDRLRVYWHVFRWYLGGCKPYFLE